MVHLDEIMESVGVKANMPVSEINADYTYDFVDGHKPFLKTAETDCRDAKRRINLVKGPSRKKKVNANPENHSGSGSDDGQASD